MTNKFVLLSTIQDAIYKADTSYFFEDYTKQARAVMAALDAAGFTVINSTLPDDIYKQIADTMKTGRVKPEEHVKDVFLAGLKQASLK